jgi:dipeptidyl aminopeptidase
VDGRGTGYLGRKLRCITRGNIGYYEAKDQIAVAKMWAKKKYVDKERMAIWGWSYGGFTTLKTLETDAGETFKYGMAVAPVTDWRFYGKHMTSNFSPSGMNALLTYVIKLDSIYTERYMHTPQNNSAGYDNSSISDVTALSKNVRFLIMHGVADDNVHMQNSLVLLDKLDMATIENYDVHVFPDSDHSIYFHNANRIVYDSEFGPSALGLWGLLLTGNRVELVACERV